MCGIVGFWGGTFDESEAKAQLHTMASMLSHRGPDDSGVWFDEKAQIGLAHRRLSIVELSLAGHQPMVSSSKRFVLIFNGEIYNHLEMRQELANVTPLTWRGHSDTETLLEAFDTWGVERTLQKAVGMFAFALWDQELQTLTLARDRMGEKPLYYGWHGRSFLFGSELKSLKCHPHFDATICKGSIALLLRHNYIPAPYSIYEHVYKLEAGHLLTLSREGKLTKKAYWSAQSCVKESTQHRFKGSFDDALSTLESLLKQSIKAQMMADVPLGAFLSGGVDSSMVVALMQAQSTQKIKTFSIGFEEARFNEAPFAKEVARHLKTEHNELYVSAKDALAVVPKLSTLYDEPFSDSSQIPTFLVSKLAKTQVCVALSGDGADELFGGYNRYTITNNLWHKITKVPLGIRKHMTKGFSHLPLEWFNYLPLRSYAHFGDKLRKGVELLSCESVDELYLGLVSHVQNPEKFVLNVKEPKTLLTADNKPFETLFGIEKMMAYDAVTYLPDDILVKVDRAAMGCSLETRVPFLDHRVVQFAWSLPFEMKFHHGEGKYILKQLLSQYIPKTLIDRPKMGFGVPLESWLRHELRDWAEALLDEKRLKNEGFFNASLVRKHWLEHVAYKQNWAYYLWDILMFQAWLDEQ